MKRKLFIGLLIVIISAFLTPTQGYSWGKKWKDCNDLSTILSPNWFEELHSYPVEILIQFHEGARPETFKAWLNKRNITDRFEEIENGMRALVGTEDGLRGVLNGGHRWRQKINILRTRVNGPKRKKDIDFRAFSVDIGALETLATIFGPEVFVRGKGRPVTETREFSTGGFQAPFILHLTNGDQEGSNRVTRARVWLNGKLLLRPSDFSRRVSGHDILVALTEPSTLEVRLAGKPGSMLTIWFEGTDPHKKIVGPEGGTFAFPNGVILEVPAGAVTEQTTIEITDLPCDEADAILLARQFASHEKRCLGGFSAKPDGLVFNVPITATVPVLPLNPGEILVQIEVDLNEQKYWITKTNLRYLGDQGLAEIELQHFPLSGEGLAALNPKEVYEVLCTDPFYNKIRPECEEIDCLQPACCLLYRDVRPPDCICCRELGQETRAEAVGFSGGDCQILGDDIEVFFPFCPYSPPESDCPNPQKHAVSETSAGCPEDMDFEITVHSPSPSLFVCQNMQLTATITGRSKDGITTFFSDALFDPMWESEDPGTADFINPTSGILEGNSAGRVTVLAKVSDDSKIPPGSAQITVEEIDLDLYISHDLFPSRHIPLSVGQTYDLTAICTPSAACPNAVDWESDADSVANVTDLGNGKARVTARSEGTANIIATSPDYCGIEIGDVVTVTVTDEEVEVASVEVEDACICVDEGFQLEVFVKDSDGNILTDRAVTWTTSDSRIAWVNEATGYAIGVREGVATIWATCEGKSDTATIEVDYCPTPGIADYRITWSYYGTAECEWDSISSSWTVHETRKREILWEGSAEVDIDVVGDAGVTNFSMSGYWHNYDQYDVTMNCDDGTSTFYTYSWDWTWTLIRPEEAKSKLFIDVREGQGYQYPHGTLYIADPFDYGLEASSLPAWGVGDYQSSGMACWGDVSDTKTIYSETLFGGVNPPGHIEADDELGWSFSKTRQLHGYCDPSNSIPTVYTWEVKVVKLNTPEIK